MMYIRNCLCMGCQGAEVKVGDSNMNYYSSQGDANNPPSCLGNPCTNGRFAVRRSGSVISQDAFLPLLDACSVADLREAVLTYLTNWLPKLEQVRIFLRNPSTEQIEAEDGALLPSNGVIWDAFHHSTLHVGPVPMDTSDPVQQILRLRGSSFYKVVLLPIPSKHRRLCLGIVVTCTRSDELSKEEDKTLRILAKQLSMAYLALQQPEPVGRSERSQIDSLIALCSDLHDQDAATLELKVIRYLQKQTCSESGFLLLLVSETQELVVQVVGNTILPEEKKFPGPGSCFAEALETKRMMFWEQIPKDRQHEVEEITGVKVHSFLCVPVMAKEGSNLMALACLVNKDQGQRYTVSDIQIVEQCFQYTSTVITNTLAFQNERKLKNQTQALLTVAKQLFTRLGESAREDNPNKGLSPFLFNVSRYVSNFRVKHKVSDDTMPTSQVHIGEDTSRKKIVKINSPEVADVPLSASRSTNATHIVSNDGTVQASEGMEDIKKRAFSVSIFRLYDPTSVDAECTESSDEKESVDATLDLVEVESQKKSTVSNPFPLSHIDTSTCPPMFARLHKRAVLSRASKTSLSATGVHQSLSDPVTKPLIEVYPPSPLKHRPHRAHTRHIRYPESLPAHSPESLSAHSPESLPAHSPESLSTHSPESLSAHSSPPKTDNRKEERVALLPSILTKEKESLKKHSMLYSFLTPQTTPHVEESDPSLTSSTKPSFGHVIRKRSVRVPVPIIPFREVREYPSSHFVLHDGQSCSYANVLRHLAPCDATYSDGDFMYDLTKLLREIMQEARNLTDSERCSVFLLDRDSDELVATVFDGITTKAKEVQGEIRLPKTQGIAGHVATTGTLLNIRDAYSHPLFYRGIDDSTGFKTRSILCFPIKDEEGVVLGVAQLCNKKAGTYFTTFDEDIASAFAVYCCISISHCLIYKRLQETQHRQRLANELMMFHMQQIPTEEVQDLARQGPPQVQTLDPHFDSFHYIPRILPDCSTPSACQAMFEDLGFINRWRMKSDTLARFILMVKKGYRNPPYHNWMHAFTVAHFSYLCIKNLRLADCLQDIELLALFVSCLCHDIDHRGTTNSFQIKSQSVLAALYSSEGSVMERHHLAQSMCILNTEGSNIYENLTSIEYQQVLDLMRDIILATDVAHHLRIFDSLQTMAKEGYKQDDPKCHYLLLSLLMTAADLSDQTKDWENTKRIAVMIYHEFFSQGDLEKALGEHPLEMMDRERACVPDLQISFLDNIAIPVYSVLAELFPGAKPAEQCVTSNRRQWEKKAEYLNNCHTSPLGLSVQQIIALGEEVEEEDTKSASNNCSNGH